VTVPAERRTAQDRIIDVLCVAVTGLLTLMVAGEAEQAGRVTGDTLFLLLVVATIGCVALWWRRRHPVAVAVLLALIATFTDFVGVAVLVAVFTVAAYRRWPVTLAVAGLHVLVIVPYSIARPDVDLTVPAVNALNIALLSIAVTLGTIVRSRRESVASMRERAARAEMEAELHAERLRALERERIAREMHDVLAHRISLVSLHAGALEIRPDLSREEVTRAAGTIRASAHQALEDLREILGVLRSGADGGSLRPQPGLDGLDELIAECRATGTDVQVDDGLPDTAPPPSVSRTAYRLVQEGLTNARKHAPDAQVRLRLARTPAGELHVSLRNRLTYAPGPAIPGARTGLVGLVERVSLAGGRLDHGARRDPDGEVAFHLEAWLPWPT
jgi:signal transduction histidine kinase